MADLQVLVDEIGAEVVACDANCPGTLRRPHEGIIPRCLFVEDRGIAGGAVVVGLNPGKSDEDERQHYRADPSYSAVKEYWAAHMKESNQYYVRLRQFLAAAGLPGSIWWTELAKCESSEKGALSISTLRACGLRFLHRELSRLPASWPVVAVGQQAFAALAYFVPERHVIGCPHPTGSFGGFHRLFTSRDRSRLVESVAAQLRAMAEAPAPQAVWLTSKAGPQA